MRIFLTIAFLSLVSCSIRPAPEQYVHVPTEVIVANIRCEMRRAIWRHAAYLAASHDENGLSVVDEKLAQQIYKLLDDPEKIVELARTPEVEALWKEYASSAVVYDFKFNINENNYGGISASAVQPFDHATSTATLGVNSTLDRTAEQRFRISDVFGNLVLLLDPQYCAEVASYHLPNNNLVYPIISDLNLVEVVNNFLSLAAKNNLVGPASAPTTQTYTEQITFKTKLVLGADPGVVTQFVIAGADSLRLSKLTLGGTASRTDTHDVTLAFALPPKKSRASGLVATSPTEKAAIDVLRSKYGQDYIDALEKLVN